jgi:hypothetical protein
LWQLAEHAVDSSQRPYQEFGTGKSGGGVEALRGAALIVSPACDYPLTAGRLPQALPEASPGVSPSHDAKMPDYLWYEICPTITYLGNLLPHSYLRDDDAPTPIQAFTGKKPNLSHLHVIGSKAHVLVPKEVRQHPDCLIVPAERYELFNGYRCTISQHIRDVIPLNEVRSHILLPPYL